MEDERMMWFLRHRRGLRVPLAEDRSEAIRLFRWYLSECAIDYLRRYRLVSEETGEVISGETMGVEPFYITNQEAGLSCESYLEGQGVA